MGEHVIAERVRSAREWRGWSQQELARRAALHPVVLNRLEKKHKAGVQAETIRRLAVALQVSADYLLGITADTLPTQAHNADRWNDIEKYRSLGEASIAGAMGLSWDVQRQTSPVTASPGPAVEPQREIRTQDQEAPAPQPKKRQRTRKVAPVA